MLDLDAGGRSLFITINARQIYGATAIKGVRVIARKTITTVEAAGLSGSNRHLHKSTKISLSYSWEGIMQALP